MRKPPSAILGIALILTALILYGFTASVNAAANSTNMSAAINSTQSYISTANQSAYLVFYPNLTSSYNYLSLAKNESQINSTYAYALLAKARQSTQEQLNAEYRYRTVSLYFLIALAVILFASLYSLMRPSKRRTAFKSLK